MAKAKESNENHRPCRGGFQIFQLPRKDYKMSKCFIFKMDLKVNLPFQCSNAMDLIQRSNKNMENGKIYEDYFLYQGLEGCLNILASEVFQTQNIFHIFRVLYSLTRQVVHTSADWIWRSKSSKQCTLHCVLISGTH